MATIPKKKKEDNNITGPRKSQKKLVNNEDAAAAPSVARACFSLDAAAEGDAVADGELADLDALVGGERLVEDEHEVAVEADVLAHGGVVGEYDGAVPQRVVVADEAPRLHQLEQPLVVVEVVVLVGVHEDEVERPVVLLLRIRDGTFVRTRWMIDLASGHSFFVRLR